MCGIFGILGVDDRGLLERMGESLRHRGPDDSGVYTDAGISLGHTRLSIIDLSERGRQPMCNEDGDIWIVYNGEIYNFKSLRADLEAKGHRFRTDTDTEVIIHSFEEYGKDCVKKLRGMFAFAIWDRKGERLFLARDRLGKKPLYYSLVEGNFIFASEIKAMLRYPGFVRKVSLEGLNAYMTHQYVPAPLTMFDGVHKLRPGHHMTVREGRVMLEKYWDIDLESNVAKSERQFISGMMMLLEDAVAMRLVSDVPLGVYLSGGLDSSTIVALASRLGEETVKTISIGFEWGGLDERPYSRIVAEKFNTEHTEIVIGGDAMKSFRDIVWHIDEPIADYAIVPTYLMSKYAKKHATVYLTGDGGDELYGGYSKYRWVRKREFLFNIPLTSRLLNLAADNKHVGDLMDNMADSRDVRNVIRSARDLKGTYIRGSRVLTEEYKKDVLARDIFESNPYELTVEPHISHAKESKGNDFLNRILYLDVKTWLAEDFLMKVDKMTMAHSVEARSPLLDQLLVEHAYTIPSYMKVGIAGKDKMIFRKAVKDILPKSIVRRKKHGFEIPFDAWLKEELKADFDNVLKFIDRTEYFRKANTMRLLEHYMKSRAKDTEYENGRRLWGLLHCFKTWHEIFMEEAGG
ncbi:MAG: asparagine synthase (glutamine-hydrolyzing) [Candidatus Altiarchaeota archaeon]